MDEDGLRVDVLAERLAAGLRPKFLYTIPEYQNPTGRTLPLDRRRELVELCRRHGVLIFEDVAYRELVVRRHVAAVAVVARRPTSCSRRGRSPRASSPACGSAGPPARADVVAELAAAKQNTDQCAGGLGQRLVEEYGRAGGFERHLPAARALYASHWAALSAALTRHMPDGRRLDRADRRLPHLAHAAGRSSTRSPCARPPSRPAWPTSRARRSTSATAAATRCGSRSATSTEPELDDRRRAPRAAWSAPRSSPRAPGRTQHGAERARSTISGMAVVHPFLSPAEFAAAQERAGWRAPIELLDGEVVVIPPSGGEASLAQTRMVHRLSAGSRRRRFRRVLTDVFVRARRRLPGARRGLLERRAGTPHRPRRRRHRARPRRRGPVAGDARERPRPEARPLPARRACARCGLSIPRSARSSSPARGETAGCSRTTSCRRRRCCRASPWASPSCSRERPSLREKGVVDPDRPVQAVVLEVLRQQIRKTVVFRVRPHVGVEPRELVGGGAPQREPDE